MWAPLNYADLPPSFQNRFPLASSVRAWTDAAPPPPPPQPPLHLGSRAISIKERSQAVQSCCRVGQVRSRVQCAGGLLLFASLHSVAGTCDPPFSHRAARAVRHMSVAPSLADCVKSHGKDSKITVEGARHRHRAASLAMSLSHSCFFGSRTH